MPRTGRAMMRSQTGKDFAGVYEEESGELLVMTKEAHGYKSAHRRFAMKHFRRAVTLTECVRWRDNRHGIPIVLTCWKTK